MVFKLFKFRLQAVVAFKVEDAGEKLEKIRTFQPSCPRTTLTESPRPTKWSEA
jgi:hypothetical protein